MEQQLFNTIIKIHNKLTSETTNNFTLIYESNKYSNTKKNIYKISINNAIISRNNNYNVEYKCINCDNISIITLNLFIRKINKHIIKCNKCREKDLCKLEKHIEFMKINARNIIKGEYIKNKKIILDSKSKIDISNEKWLSMDDIFKNKYNQIHLNKDEFSNICSKIISIQNDKISKNDLHKWEYIEHLIINNQTKFNPFLYNSLEKTFEKLLYIKLKCENCDEIFILKELKLLKNSYKILCKSCKFTNKTFKIRYINNNNNQKVRYQSNLELHFIEWCNINNIHIINGPVIKYKILNEDIEKKYYLDFELPQYNLLVELKDNHCWHQYQINKGIFDSKNKYAIEYANNNGKTFIVVFNNDINKFKDDILKKYTYKI
jgi:hypothetical protein